MVKPKVLISGGGIAGNVLAYWLGKHGFRVVVIERASSRGTAGQVIDVAGPAEEIVKRMGLLDEIQRRATHEAGFQLVYPDNRAVGTVPAGTSSASKEIEIMRPELADILYNAAVDSGDVEFRFNTTIQSLSNTKDSVTVETIESKTNTTAKENFDMLVACDGLRSRTRNMILPPEERESCVKSINAFVAFFSIPAEPQDRPYFRVCQFPGRINLATKPENEKRTSVYIGCVKYVQSLHDARESRDVDQQKAAVRDYFTGLGWETERILKGMMETDNFYFEELSQVYLDKWSRGRCVLLGDTAYAPSPLTGQGTPLAIVGAYLLASKLIENPEDPEKAFEAYEKEYRPYVNKKQPIPLRGTAPLILNPETALGIWLLRTIFAVVTWLAPWRFFPESKAESYPLPDI